MTCVGISRKWNELNFMGTDDVISSNVFMLDDDGVGDFLEGKMVVYVLVNFAMNSNEEPKGKDQPQKRLMTHEVVTMQTTRIVMITWDFQYSDDNLGFSGSLMLWEECEALLKKHGDFSLGNGSE
ncbi:hypothetical protein C5167_049270 [Papaver somniferum]|uniref:Uncharacterized protein n=1 Tax=Papaver somniferum TaxID=3469 RepID=A0A4Y7KN76_PAPSO|nr:hypothetical protein C5167_049270 [Papaver somniferum]